MQSKIKQKFDLITPVIKEALSLMATSVSMTDCFEDHFKVTSKYVHATSRGHEAIQIALGMLLKKDDFVSPYYRDDALLLAIGMQPRELMLQLLAKKSDPFSGGRTYYAHPSLNDPDKPKIIHQSSATGMQAIPSAGIAMGIKYREKHNIEQWDLEESPIAICSIGDASMTEGEVAEAMQAAALYQLPLLFLVQDNGWDISAKAEEVRAMNAYEYAAGFPGIKRYSIDGSDFTDCYLTMQSAFTHLRKRKGPVLIHATVPLLNHHTSGVRKEWYRDDLEIHQLDDPFPKLCRLAKEHQIDVNEVIKRAQSLVQDDYDFAVAAQNPSAESIYDHIFSQTAITHEIGDRHPENTPVKNMVDSGLFAVKQLMEDHLEAVVYGQDVGARLGGVFREAATLGTIFGADRVFNTAIQEAFIIGSTVGMSAMGLKPIVEVQFADYIWPGLNQLFSEVSRSCYLSEGKWPVDMVLRVPTGAYGAGGPYHSSSVETILTGIKGIKVVYPSCGADLFGLLKSAYDDPNPVVILEHKGLYWSKMPFTEGATSPLPSRDYRIPIGKAVMVEEPEHFSELSQHALIITYGMGVHWARQAVKMTGKEGIGIMDLRSLAPFDKDLIKEKVGEYNRVLLVTEESREKSYMQSLAGYIQEYCFHMLDAPIFTIGAENVPAIPLNEILEKAVLPNPEKVAATLNELLQY